VSWADDCELEYVIGDLKEENAKLREFVSQLMAFIDPTEHQDTCNRECPAYDKCAGSTFCEFPYWALKRAREFGIEVD
jgi:hypothetical protein